MKNSDSLLHCYQRFLLRWWIWWNLHCDHWWRWKWWLCMVWDVQLDCVNTVVSYTRVVCQCSTVWSQCCGWLSSSWSWEPGLYTTVHTVHHMIVGTKTIFVSSTLTLKLSQHQSMQRKEITDVSATTDKDNEIFLHNWPHWIITYTMSWAHTSAWSWCCCPGQSMLTSWSWFYMDNSTCDVIGFTQTLYWYIWTVWCLIVFSFIWSTSKCV